MTFLPVAPGRLRRVVSARQLAACGLYQKAKLGCDDNVRLFSVSWSAGIRPPGTEAKFGLRGITRAWKIMPGARPEEEVHDCLNLI